MTEATSYTKTIAGQHFHFNCNQIFSEGNYSTSHSASVIQSCSETRLHTYT